MFVWAMSLNEVMATNLRRVRHEKEMTQEGLAHLAGLSMRYAGKIERTEVSITISVLEKIAIALEVEASDLLKPRS